MPDLRSRRLLRLLARQHAGLHAQVVGHAIVQSFEPGEDWRWCYFDETYV